MGFGSSPQPVQPPVSNAGGFSFGAPSQPAPSFTQPPQPQPAVDFGFGFGSGPTSQPAPKASVAQSGFVPIVNNNPNKILAYDNTHIQVWIDCVK